MPEAWNDGNFLRFHAPESNTYTAVFTKDTQSGIAEATDGGNSAKILRTYRLNGQPAGQLVRGNVYVQKGRKFIAE